jgi:hypothetical protein
MFGASFRGHMGASPINEQELANAGVFNSGGHNFHGVNSDQESEEEILRRVMEESLKMHEAEEEKRKHHDDDKGEEQK